MKWIRIKAIYYRYLYNFFRLEQMTDVFFWPLFDIFIWGITMVWLQQMEAKFSLALPILTALVFWQVVWRSNYEVSVNILQELWSRNFVNLFSTPLKVSEWITALMILGITKNAVTIAFGGGVVMLLYSLNIFSLGWPFFPLLAAFIISGWWCGFLSSSIIVYYGQRMQMLAWVSGYIFSPFSAVFYPLKALPEWASPIAKALPMSHLFESMREYYATGVFNWSEYWFSMLLNGAYLAACIFLFRVLFEKSRDKGLARLE
jgi:ABC-2 type transport system permease protein